MVFREDIDANGLVTHTVYQGLIATQDIFIILDKGSTPMMIMEIGLQICTSYNSEGPIIWRDENLWTMEYSQDTLMTETYQYNDWDYGNGELINSYRYRYFYLYGNMIQRNQDYYSADTDWYEYYLTIYTWEEATHDGGEVTGVEYYFESVGEMFSVFGDILESGGDGCVDCEGNLDNMSGHLLGHIDEASVN